MRIISVTSAAIGTLSLLLASSAMAATDLKPAPLNNSGCPPSNPFHPNCPPFGDIGGECCPFSDDNLKTNVIPLKTATEQLLKIKGVTFEWKGDGRKDIGVIAQDVAKVYPELTRNRDGMMQVDYPKLVAPLIESIRELNQRIAVLEKAQGKAK